VNLPAGEVYFVPTDAAGSFPVKFEEGTLAVMHVENKKINKVTLLRGNQATVDELQKKLDQDPATGILGELGFGTQVLPPSGSDIQDEKIAGTFHLAIGRNDHLNGSVTLHDFVHAGNATHEDILFSSHKTPEILVKEVRMKRQGRAEILIQEYKPSAFLENLLVEV
jgi:leucyl aminopeptidase (aminopeptidase T)